MKIGAKYSHLNGLEWLLVHRRALWREINDVIESIDAEAFRLKRSKEKRKKGSMLLSPIHVNEAVKTRFKAKGWQSTVYPYWVTDDYNLTLRTVGLSASNQKQRLIEAGKKPIRSYHQTDFEKNRVAVEVQLGKYSFIEFDLFVKHLGFFIGDRIDLGVEIIPTKKMQDQMSSGPGYYERVLHHIARQGRGSPAVPLILIGVEP